MKLPDWAKALTRLAAIVAVALVGGLVATPSNAGALAPVSSGLKPALAADTAGLTTVGYYKRWGYRSHRRVYSRYYKPRVRYYGYYKPRRHYYSYYKPRRHYGYYKTRRYYGYHKPYRRHYVKRRHYPHVVYHKYRKHHGLAGWHVGYYRHGHPRLRLYGVHW
ncbi:MAG: hypothetical protein GC150_11940 [Rhizobiales bacterium]|nr:hypothetical protein [Hyphomicrobiales bacterium]